MQKMRALEVGHGPDWTMVQKEIPQPGPGEVLIRVRAAGSNNGDLPMLEGADPSGGGSGQTQTAGFEHAGEVVALGEGVHSWQVGDPVMGSVPGAMAEYVVSDARFVMPRPAALPPEQACVLPVGLLTEHGALAVAGSTTGETVLVTGASSGVGLVGVQVAKALGASRVIGTTRREELRPVLEQLGVDDVLVTSGEGLAEQVLGLTEDRGVDVVLDHLGAPVFAECLAATAEDGHVVPVGRAAGAQATISLDQIGYHHLTVHGVSFGFGRAQEMAEVVAALRPEVLPALARGEIRPVVDAVFAVQDHQKALQRLRSGKAVGKVAITFDR